MVQMPMIFCRNLQSKIIDYAFIETIIPRECRGGRSAIEKASCEHWNRVLKEEKNVGIRLREKNPGKGKNI